MSDPDRPRDAGQSPWRSEGLLHGLFESALEPMFLVNEAGAIVEANPAAAALLSLGREALRGRPLADFVAEADRPRMEAELGRLLARPAASTRFEVRVRHRDEGRRWFEMTATNLLHDPEVRALVASFRDATERRAVALERDHFFNLSRDLLCVAGMDGRFRRLNPAWERTLGWPLEEMVSRHWLDFVHPDDQQATAREGARLADGSMTARFENRYRCKDGSYRWLQWVSLPAVEEGLIYATARDLTDVRAAVERDRLLFAQSPVPMFLIDGETLRFLDVNDAALSMYGHSREEMLAMSLDQVVVADQQANLRERADQALAEGIVHVLRRRHRTRSGAELAVEVTAHRLTIGGRGALLSVVRDVSEQLRLQEQLVQSQKMEAVGSLAGGVAHDFNNLLSAILSYSSMALSGGTLDARLRGDLEQIQRAGERAADLTRQLLAFSRRQILQPRVVDLNEIVAGMDKMLRRLIGENIEFVTLPAAQPAMVDVDPAQMDQVIVNLAINARDAMPGGGKLTVELRHLQLDESYAAAHPGVRAGPYLSLVVSDTGVGMDEATKARIFEPFFTTKGVGKGTGLGLSTVFGIVRQSGGHVSVVSEAGKGSSFKVCLPVAAKGADLPLPAGEGGPGELRGSETVLLVEDEEQVRTLARSILTRAGYRVLEAQGGDEALGIAGRGDQPIELLLTDLVMPRVGGVSLAAQLVALRPGLRVLYMSGYTDDSVLDQGLPPGANFLQKPLTPQGLLRKVRQALAVAPPKPARPRVLLLDDQVVMLRLLSRALSQYEVTQQSDPALALEQLRKGARFDAIICDFYMPGMTGANLQDELRKLDAGQAGRMLFITGAMLDGEAGDFARANAGRVLQKPVDLEALRTAVAGLLRGG